MTNNPISWVTGGYSITFAPCPHIVRRSLDTRYPPGIHVDWTLGNQHDGKALPGRRSCCPRRSMGQCIAGGNRLLTCCFCWLPSSDVETSFRCSSVTIGCRTSWRFQAFSGTYKKWWSSSSYLFLEFHPQRVRRGFTTGAFLILLNKVNCPAFMMKAGTPA